VTKTNIIRLHADGLVDTDFAGGIGVSSYVKAIALAGDDSGDIYVGGDFTIYSSTLMADRIIRLAIDGTVR